MLELLPDFAVENYTAHPIVLVEIDGTERIIDQEPRAPIRLNTMRVKINRYLSRVEFSEPTFMPEARPGVFYIVSSPVKLAMPLRQDLVTPNDLVRDYSGRVTACRGFAL